MLFVTRIPIGSATSLRADEPQGLVGKAVRPDEWPELRKVSDKHHLIMPPYMLVRSYRWTPSSDGDTADIRFVLTDIAFHKFYPLAREILTKKCETIQVATREHAAKLFSTPCRYRVRAKEPE